MAKGIFVVHYNKKGLDVKDQGSQIEVQFKAFVSPKAADLFIADLVLKYPKAWAKRSETILYTVGVQPEID